MRARELERRRIGAALALIVAMLAPPAWSQSFDCSRAEAAVERAICASPTLRQRDTDLAAAFAANLARDPAQADAVRLAQRGWLRTRNGCMTTPATTASCLDEAYAERIAALTPPPTPVPPAAEAAATLERTRIPTAGQTDVLLHVTTPGRFAIRAASATGTALQLVDMLVGPGEQAGIPGKTDGRIDALLDLGTYKLRAFGQDGAQGTTELSVTPFTDAAPPLLAPGYQPTLLRLADLQQQSFWLVVGAADDALRIEVAGRSLDAVRIWHDGRDLVAVPEQRDRIAPAPSHPLTDIVLEQRLPPGSYLVTAYGGPALPWADGAADQPLYVRTGRSDDVRAGGASGSVGPFGSEVFAAAPDAAQALLVLPKAADATLRALAGGDEAARIDIPRTQRAPAVLLDLPAKGSAVELRAAPGSLFTLRALPAAGSMPEGKDRSLLAAAALAEGGDEAPAAALLARFDANGMGEVLASPGVPQIGPAGAWRTRFNLRGPTRLLFHVTAAMTVAVRAEGPPVAPLVTTPEGAVMNATGNGRTATSWSLSPGWYVLALRQAKPAPGILDLTLGPPGVLPAAPEPAGPANPVLPLGEHAAAVTGSSLRLFANAVPDGEPRLISRKLPVALTAGPVVLTPAAGDAPTLDLAIDRPGRLVVRDVDTATVLEQRVVAKGDTPAITLPSADRARTLAVAWLPPQTQATPSPAPLADLPVLRDGAPLFLDLARDQQASFSVQIAQGGLFRLATLGRLATEGRLGTAFLPALEQASGNGVGANMLLQRTLRAGRYRLDVTARGSSGRLGVVAAPAVLAEGATLLPGLSVRASLPAGGGVAFPVRIAEKGRYHLDLLGLGGKFTARLEDAEGWPLLVQSDLTSLDQDFVPGSYRLIVQPPAVAAQVVARLTRIEPPANIEGHGPHALPFEVAQSATWREPARRDAPRTPDAWTFSLAGPAKITLELTGDGMVAALRADAPDAAPLGRVLGGAKLVQTLPAGRYVVDASAQGRNDRLDYSVVLHSEELQPATPRVEKLPAEVPFAIAAPRVMSLTSFGDVPLRAVLHAEDGSVLARVVGRTDDWNIALSRPLPAGRYRLELSALPVPAATPAKEAAQPDQPAPDQGMAQDQQPAPTAEAEPAALQTELTLALPADLPDQALAADGGATLTGAGVHHVPLATAAPGTLLAVAAEAPVEVVLAVQARAPDGAWRQVGQDQGRAPLLAIPGDGGIWRASVWAVDGADAPVRFAVHTVAGPAQPPGLVRLAPVPLAGLGASVFAAAVHDSGAVALLAKGAPPDLLAASLPAEPAVPPVGGIVGAQSETVWLIARTAQVDVTPAAVPPNGAMALTLPEGARANVPLSAPAEGSTCACVAASGLGQPGLDGGRGMGVAEGSALALCGGATVSAWNAGNADALRITLRRERLTLAPSEQIELAFAGTVAAHTALPLRLPAGSKRLDASLAAGNALVAGWTAADAVTAWAGDAPLSRSLAGDWTDVLLVNAADTPAPAALTSVPADPATPLTASAVLRRFFGADGSFVLPITARPGQRLLLAGNATATALRADGQVREGTDIPLDGPGSAVITHHAGALALWLEGDGASPWPGAAPQDVALPVRVPLSGEAMALHLAPGAPALLHLRSTAPLILAFGDQRPALYGQGATLDRYLAGETVLRLLSPQDGPLSGTLELAATPVAEVAEGMGAPVAVGPGGAAVFGFRITGEGPVGLGVRADPDRVAVRLLDETGRELDHGVALLHRLAPGHYLLEASVPPDAPTTLLRPAVLGISPHPTPPPPELVRQLLIAAGFAPPDAGDTP
jgi:uncharacterized protein